MNPPLSGKGHGFLLVACAILLLVAFINCHWQIETGGVFSTFKRPIFAPPTYGRPSIMIAPLVGKIAIIGVVYGVGRFALQSETRGLIAASWILVAFSVLMLTA